MECPCTCAACKVQLGKPAAAISMRRMSIAWHQSACRAGAHLAELQEVHKIHGQLRGIVAASQLLGLRAGRARQVAALERALVAG